MVSLGEFAVCLGVLAVSLGATLVNLGKFVVRLGAFAVSVRGDGTCERVSGSLPSTVCARLLRSFIAVAATARLASPARKNSSASPSEGSVTGFGFEAWGVDFLFSASWNYGIGFGVWGLTLSRFTVYSS